MGIFSEEFKFLSTSQFIPRFGLNLHCLDLISKGDSGVNSVCLGQSKKVCSLDLQYWRRISVYDKSVRGGNWFEFISQKIQDAVLNSQCLCV